MSNNIFKMIGKLFMKNKWETKAVIYCHAFEGERSKSNYTGTLIFTLEEGRFGKRRYSHKSSQDDINPLDFPLFLLVVIPWVQRLKVPEFMPLEDAVKMSGESCVSLFGVTDPELGQLPLGMGGTVVDFPKIKK